MTLYVHGSDKTFERAVEVEVKDDGRVIVGIGQPAMYDIEDVLTTTIIENSIIAFDAQGRNFGVDGMVFVLLNEFMVEIVKKLLPLVTEGK